MTDWEEVIATAQRYEQKRLDDPTKYLQDLLPIIGDNVRIWTDPFGRGYQYEFLLKEGNPELSFIVEISEAVNVAAAYYARRTFCDNAYTDECADHVPEATWMNLRQRVVELLRNAGFDVIPYDELDVIRHGKPTYKWLFRDPEE